MKKFKLFRSDLQEKHLTPAEKKKREEIAMAMEREHPGMPMGKKMAIATAAAKKVAEENLDELKNSTLDSYIDKVSTGPSRGTTQTGVLKSIKAISGTTTAIRKKVENDQKEIKEEKPGLWANIHAKRERIKNGSGEHMRTPGSKGAPSAQDFKDAAKTSKNEEYTIDESVKTTHEDPLVTVHHTDGELWTHANLSVANAIHKTKVSHHSVHAGPTKSGDWTFNISKHHDKAVKDDAKGKQQFGESVLDENAYTFEPATHKPTIRNSRGHSFEGNTYNAKGLKGASIYKHKDTGKYYADKISAATTFHSSAKEAAEKYHNKAK